MKRKRNMIILAVCLVVLCGVIGIEKAVTQHVDSISMTDEIILTVDADTLTQMSWSYNEETLDFVNSDGTWQDSADADFPVDQEEIADFLEHFAEVHACFIIDDVEDYEQYGLSEPQCTITLTSDEGDTVIELGGYSTMDEQRYMTLGEGTVYLIEDDLLDYVTTDRDDFMLNDEIPTYDILSELTIEGEDTLNVVYDEDGNYSYSDSYSYYLKENTTRYALSSTSVGSYLNTIRTLSLTDYATYTASADDLSQYGLDNPALTITVEGTLESEDEDSEETEEAVEFVLYIGAVEDEDAEVEEGEETPVNAYVRIGDSEIVYNLSSSAYETLSGASYDTLRPTEVVSLDWDNVTGASFEIDGEAYEVSIMTRGEWKEMQASEDSEEESSSDETDTDESEEEATTEAETETETESEEDEDDEEIIYILNGQEIDFAAVKSAANALDIESFTDDEPDKTEEISMTIYVDNSKYPSVEVTIYRYDGDYCLVLVDGETVGLMERSLMVDLREAVTSIVIGME